MPIATTETGTELYYEVKGRSDDPTLLLIMGYTAQLITWPNGFVESLTSRGFRVVMFDNRDSGLSSKTPGVLESSVELLFRAQAGEDVSGDTPYSLSDMADDAVTVLEAAGAGSAHVVGASMGAMISQHMAIEHADRVESLTSIMSTTGDGSVGGGDPEVVTALVTPAPVERQASIAHAVEVNRLIAGPLWNRELAVETTTAAWDRMFHPPGASFQMGAMAASGDRTERLRSVSAPTLVVHGRHDRLIDKSGGIATAEAIEHSDLLLLGQMGHDLPSAVWNQMADAITANCQKAN